MDASLLYHHLKTFMSRHGITRDLPCRIGKLRTEVKELDDAIENKDVGAIIKEAADVAIIAFDIMLICGAQPIWSMYLKLCEVAERPEYKQIAERRKKDAQPRT